MSYFFPAGQHPDADQLNAFAEHALPAHEQQQTLAHLAECAACRQVVALSLPPREQVEVVRSSWFSRWHLAWAGIPALAVLVLLVVSIRTGQVQKPAATEMGAMRASVPPAQPVPATAPEPPPVAALKQPPRTQRLHPPAPTQSASGVMGGILGGVGSASPQAATSSTVAVASGGPQFALAQRSARALLPVSISLPSHLAALSTASQGSRWLAVDTSNQVFLSADDGQHWQAVPAQWNGRAVRVAVAGTAAAVGGAAAASPTANAFLAGPSGASISGTVVDTTGAVIPGATVSAVDNNGTVARAVTDQKGQFRLEHLAKGRYQIEAEAPGFLKQSSMAELAVAQQAVVSLTMQVGMVTEKVTVQAETAPAAADKLSATAEKAGPKFELITTDGSRWVSADGLTWARN